MLCAADVQRLVIFMSTVHAENVKEKLFPGPWNTDTGRIQEYFWSAITHQKAQVSAMKETRRVSNESSVCIYIRRLRVPGDILQPA